MLIAMTRNPLSASISRTVKTVSYKIELPTFFVASVFVATYPTIRTNQNGARSTHLCEDIVHLVASLRVTPSEQAQQAQQLDLQERVGDAADVMFGAVTGGSERLEMLDQQPCSLNHQPRTSLRDR
jgi:hypothetical protein